MVELKVNAVLTPNSLPKPLLKDSNSGLAPSKTQLSLTPSLQVGADSLNILKNSPTAGYELTPAWAPGRQRTWLTANSALPSMQNDILALGIYWVTQSLLLKSRSFQTLQCSIKKEPNWIRDWPTTLLASQRAHIYRDIEAKCTVSSVSLIFFLNSKELQFSGTAYWTGQSISSHPLWHLGN